MGNGKDPYCVKSRTMIEEHDKLLDEIKGDVKEIKDRLLNRPSWFVTILITSLVSAVGVMGFYIVTHKGDSNGKLVNNQSREQCDSSVIAVVD